MALFLQSYRVTASQQTNIRGFGFGSVPVTALLVYLFQLVPIIFTYVLIVLVTTRRKDVSGFDVIWATYRVGSGRVPGQKF